MISLLARRRPRRPLIAALLIVALAAAVAAVIALFFVNKGDGCPIADSDFCDFGLELEKALNAGNVEFVVAAGKTVRCSGRQAEPQPSNCLPLTGVYLGEAGFWYETGSFVPPETYRLELARWLEGKELAVHGIGVSSDGAPAGLLYTDGSSYLRFRLQRQGRDYLIEWTTTAPKGSLDVMQVFTWRDWRGCPIKEPALCDLALKLEKAVAARDLESIMAVATRNRCEADPQTSDCLNLSSVYPGRDMPGTWYGEGFAFKPEGYQFYVGRWLEGKDFAIHSVGMSTDGAPAALVFTDGSSYLMFRLQRQGNGDLVERTTKAPPGSLDFLRGFIWTDWRR